MRRLFLGLIVIAIPAIQIATLMAQIPKLSVDPARPVDPPKVILVELFTSEGCSSCPPADALLRKINGAQTAAGQLVVGISEHVTYWNSLGWSDPFSSPVYTERQNAYGAAFHLDSVYTPQIVINGEQQVLGSDSAGLARAIRREEENPSQVTVDIISATIMGRSLRINFMIAGDSRAHDSDVVAVIVDDTDESSVLRGENSGRTLAHVSVARSIQRIGKVQLATEQTGELALPISFHQLQKHHLILFAQAAGTGKIFAADITPL